MKKVFLLFAFAVVSICLKAQPIINNNVFPVIGDTIYRALDSVLVAPGNSGPNVTWNFASLPVHVNVSRIYVSPSATPYGSSFPNATLCRTDAIGSNYTYWKNSTAKAMYYGFVEPNKYDQNYNSLAPNFYLFPITYGSSHSDSISATTNPGSIVGSGKYYFNADGWGTLILPHKTVSNVLRTKSVLYVGDSSINSYSLSTDYAWYEANRKDPLLIISSVIINKTLYKKFVFFDNSWGTGLTNQSALEGVSIWPNPSRELLNINLGDRFSNQEVSYQILAIDGRLIDQGKLSNDATIDVVNLDPGMYVIALVSKDALKPILFKKE